MMGENSFLQIFFKFMNMVTERPGMFLVNNVEDISLVIFGYKNGCSSDSKNYQLLNQILDEFGIFVNAEFATTEYFDWVKLIRFYATGNNSSIELFSVKFQRFIASAYSQSE